MKMAARTSAASAPSLPFTIPHPPQSLFPQACCNPRVKILHYLRGSEVHRPSAVALLGPRFHDPPDRGMHLLLQEFRQVAVGQLVIVVQEGPVHGPQSFRSPAS